MKKVIINFGLLVIGFYLASLADNIYNKVFRFYMKRNIDLCLSETYKGQRYTPITENTFKNIA